MSTPAPAPDDGGNLKNFMKSMRPKTNSESGSSNGGNNSDNSALISIGNTSFGFNFDSDEGKMSNNSGPRNGEQNDVSEDSDGNGPLDSKMVAVSATSADQSKQENGPQHEPPTMRTPASSLANSTQSNDGAASAAHLEAAANAVANLQSIASTYADKDVEGDGKPSALSSPKKRKVSGRSDNDSGGYNTDDEGNEGIAQAVESSSKAKAAPSRVISTAVSAPGSPKGKKKKKLDEKKREERNAREKERSFRISHQINELRALLSNGGVVVPKGTKSSVLTECANYIRMLQQHQYRSEIDRHQLVQQMQLIGSGAHGPQAAAAIRHVAAQNGVWSLGNFGGVPPKSAMTFYKPSEEPPEQAQSQDSVQPSKVERSEYRFVFNSCGVGMAIASMGGAFIDCNHLFCQLSNYTKQEVCSLTIFNMTARQDLQHAFDLISQMISPPMDGRAQDAPKSIVLRGSMKNRGDIGLNVSLVKGDDGIAKCFCVTLIRNPASPFDTSKPIPVSFDSIMPQTSTISVQPAQKAEGADGLNSAPAFTSG